MWSCLFLLKILWYLLIVLRLNTKWSIWLAELFMTWLQHSCQAYALAHMGWTSLIFSTKILSVNPTTVEVESLIAPIFPKEGLEKLSYLPKNMKLENADIRHCLRGEIFNTHSRSLLTGLPPGITAGKSTFSTFPAFLTIWVVFWPMIHRAEVHQGFRGSF